MIPFYLVSCFLLALFIAVIIRMTTTDTKRDIRCTFTVAFVVVFLKARVFPLSVVISIAPPFLAIFSFLFCRVILLSSSPSWNHPSLSPNVFRIQLNQSNRADTQDNVSRRDFDLYLSLMPFFFYGNSKSIPYSNKMSPLYTVSEIIITFGDDAAGWSLCFLETLFSYQLLIADNARTRRPNKSKDHKTKSKNK